eukprot:CFRG6568T1
MSKVFPRYKGLVESGAIKETVLYKIMNAIPPHSYPGRSNHVTPIKFADDKLRKNFHRSQLGKESEITPLYEASATSLCDEFVSVQKEMMEKKMSEREAFLETEKILKTRMNRQTTPVADAQRDNDKIISDLLAHIRLNQPAAKGSFGRQGSTGSSFFKRD